MCAATEVFIPLFRININGHVFWAMASARALFLVVAQQSNWAGGMWQVAWGMQHVA